MTSNRKFFEIGGIIAGLILVIFGTVSLVMGIQGRSTVSSSLKQEQITGSSDMTPALIKVEAAKAGLTGIALPTCTVADKAVNNGSTARCFAAYMRIHTLEATGGYTYSQMGQYVALPSTPKAELASPGSTSNKQYAVIDAATKQPVSNGARNIWVTETALTTALNTSYMAEQVALFSVVTGIAFLLTGVGFLVLALGGALRRLVPSTDVRRPHAASASA
jgi:hypothetical protein